MFRKQKARQILYEYKIRGIRRNVNECGVCTGHSICIYGLFIIRGVCIGIFGDALCDAGPRLDIISGRGNCIDQATTLNTIDVVDSIIVGALNIVDASASDIAITDFTVAVDIAFHGRILFYFILAVIAVVTVSFTGLLQIPFEITVDILDSRQAKTTVFGIGIFEYEFQLSQEVVPYSIRRTCKGNMNLEDNTVLISCKNFFGSAFLGDIPADIDRCTIFIQLPNRAWNLCIIPAFDFSGSDDTVVKSVFKVFFGQPHIFHIFICGVLVSIRRFNSCIITRASVLHNEFSDTEVAALLGKFLLKKTIIQRDDIRALKATLHEKELEITHVKKENRKMKKLEHDRTNLFGEIEEEREREKSRMGRYASELEISKDTIMRLREEVAFLKQTINKMENDCRSVEFGLEAGSNLSVVQQRCVSRDAFPGKQIPHQTERERTLKALKCVEANRDYYKQRFFEADEEKKEMELDLKELQLQLQKALDDASKWEEKASQSIPVVHWRRYEITDSHLRECNTCSSRHEYELASMGLKKEIEIETGRIFNMADFETHKRWRIREAVFGDLFRRLTEFVRNWLTHNNSD
ncbi:uncharacterized protein LOC106877695 [Octopus bimaculoides]|uniref:uncharacterized protein LOC106877695 n=1 Tax=Octopus bimaculoides TaxID=37653 RepID=UPI00071CF17F|nr:uncharacterized protein LOC106877695 [Octopus bimaculoides]|eukprot:XP_014782133.1 PREDICTED: uncharacterized protein LOC106877695 [Octopus bimaculoides]